MLGVSQEDIDEGKKLMIKDLESGKIKCFDTKLRFEIKKQGYLWNSWETKSDTFMDCANNFGQEDPEYLCKKGICRNMKMIDRKQLTTENYKNGSFVRNSSDDLRSYIDIYRF